MKKTLLSILSIILVFGVFSFPNQLPLAGESTIAPTNEPTIEPINAPIVGSTIEPTDETTNGPGFVLSSDIPDTHEAKEIIKAIERSYDIEVEAAYTFDLSKFPNVFINDPRFPVSSGTLETVRQLTLNPVLESAGWLDYKMAFYSWRRDSTLLSEAVQAKAKVENRDLTEEERKSLRDPWGRTAPARSESPTRSIAINYLTMEINNDTATVTLRRGIYHSEIKLVLVDGRWYFAKERFLSVSP
jgi:hypothetical protein